MISRNYRTLVIGLGPIVPLSIASSTKKIDKVYKRSLKLCSEEMQEISPEITR